LAEYVPAAMTNRFGVVLHSESVRWAAAEGVSETVIAAVLLLHERRGRGKHSRQTPQELVAVGDRVGVDGTILAKASRLVAKVDSAAVQDGFDLYLHGFVVTDDGHWLLARARGKAERRAGFGPRFGWRRRFRFDEMTAAMAAATSELGGRLRQQADRNSTAMAR